MMIDAASKVDNPTIRDVARLAEVSPQTVSRVLNTPDKVRKTTRERVLRAISVLGYRRSPLAWGLATSRSGAIGIVDSGSGAIGQTQLVSAIESAARDKGYSPRIATVGNTATNTIHAAHQTLSDEMVEGLIVLGNTTLEVHEALAVSEGLPTVLVSSNAVLSERVSTLSLDQREGASLMVRHLSRHGDRIGLISGPQGWLDADLRLRGWLETTPTVDTSLVRFGDWTAESGYRAMKELLDEDVDAVFGGNDLMSLGAIWACVEAGLSVPEDIAVGGFDDLPGADYFNPPMTTVLQPFTKMGHLAMQLLHELLEGNASRSVVLTPQLILRKSA